ncbi:hypothetical protein BP6252_11049 [Coleophoma cylindrospora]|uniref:Mid2 domain-containing protein n=1 Tax=Coleophoma cylindrospora TaxID=1849047 RepID=A0A3D8QPW3_9HELO|nr:hypothetical protein BP6252_11049 [Coleophoma cylindrospora]
MSLYLCSLLVFTGNTYAILWGGAKPTCDSRVEHVTEPPEPTTAALLHQRQGGTLQTCGYSLGISTSPLYCVDARAVCATNSLSGFGCCLSTGITNCLIPTSCIDSTAVGNYGSSFLNNPYVTSCTNSGASLCVTRAIEYSPSFVTGWGCTDSLGATFELYYSTTSTASNASTASGRSFSPITVFQANYISTSSTTTSTSTSSSSTTTSPTSTTTTSITTTPIINTPGPATKSSSTPIGAIVGGTVGGVAVIALCALALFFMLRKRKNNDHSAPFQQPTALPSNNNYGPPPGGHAAYPTEKIHDSTSPGYQGDPYGAAGGAPPYSQPGGQSSYHDSTISPISPSVNQPMPAPVHELGSH